MWIDEKLFVQSVQEHFLFLQTDYGMNIKDKGIPECVRFESNITWIEIWFDKYSLFIEIGTNDGLYQVSLWDIKQFTTGDGKSVTYMASDEEKLNKGLHLLADNVKVYAHRALSGDIEFYKEIQTQ